MGHLSLPSTSRENWQYDLTLYNHIGPSYALLVLYAISYTDLIHFTIPAMSLLVRYIPEHSEALYSESFRREVLGLENSR